MSDFLTMEQFLAMDTTDTEKSEWEWKRIGVKIPIRSVLPDVYYRARKAAMKISVTGKKAKAERKVEFDELRLKAEIIIAGIDTDRTDFRLDSPQLLSRYGKVAAVDVVPCVFRPSEIDSLYEAIAEISDFDDEDSEVDEVKN